MEGKDDQNRKLREKEFQSSEGLSLLHLGWIKESWVQNSSISICKDALNSWSEVVINMT
jgi:hypothetical protein